MGLGPEQVAGAALLDLLVVDGAAQFEVAGVVELVGSDQPRADGGEAGVACAARPVSRVRGMGDLERIAARRTELDVLAEELAKRLQEVRDEREELLVAERVLNRLTERKPPHESTTSSTPATS